MLDHRRAHAIFLVRRLQHDRPFARSGRNLPIIAELEKCSNPRLGTKAESQKWVNSNSQQHRRNDFSSSMKINVGGSPVTSSNAASLLMKNWPFGLIIAISAMLCMPNSRRKAVKIAFSTLPCRNRKPCRNLCFAGPAVQITRWCKLRHAFMAEFRNEQASEAVSNANFSDL